MRNLGGFHQQPPVVQTSKPLNLPPKIPLMLPLARFKPLEVWKRVSGEKNMSRWRVCGGGEVASCFIGRGLVNEQNVPGGGRCK